MYSIHMLSLPYNCVCHVEPYNHQKDLMSDSNEYPGRQDPAD